MGDYVIKVKALTDALASAGNQLTNMDIIDFVVKGLSVDYCPFISSMHSQLNIVFEDFLHLLIREDNFMKRQPSTIDTTTSPSVFSMSTTSILIKFLITMPRTTKNIKIKVAPRVVGLNLLAPLLSDSFATR